MSTLEEECGVTAVSTRNADLLIRDYGIPKKIELYYDPDEWYQVKAEFEEYGEHIFTGFSWGYGGEGCRGLKHFLEKCQCQPINVGHLDTENPEPKVIVPMNGILENSFF